MSLKIVIDSVEVETKTGTSTRGAPYSIPEQVGYLHAGKEVRKVILTLGKGASPYSVGVYEVADESFTTGPFGNLTIGRLVLRPIRPAVQASPARQAG